MTYNYRSNLFIALFSCAIIIAFSISIIDFITVKNKVLERNKQQVNEVTEWVRHSLVTIDKVYDLLDDSLSTDMEKNIALLQEKYKHDNNIHDWNYEELANDLGMDVYVIDDENVIIQSNLRKEIGLDFTECCQTLSDILNERRASGGLYIDEMDLQLETGNVKKFSYMATADKKYIFELGVHLENEIVFSKFNFIDESKQLLNRFPLILELNILNFGGKAYGQAGFEFSNEKRYKAFDEARQTLEVVEILNEYENESAYYRYIPILSDTDESATKLKVVEIVYPESVMTDYVNSLVKNLIIKLAVILLVTVIIAFILAHWFSKYIYLGLHDGLTQLKNRVAFDECMIKLQQADYDLIAFLMFDLDNFKGVNDELGHIKGDELLAEIGVQLKGMVNSVNSEAFRLGGDEFVIVLCHTSEREAEVMAQNIITLTNEVFAKDNELYDLNIAVSIGISLTSTIDGVSQLYNQADIALYEAKAQGKNQYRFYQS